MKPHYKNFNKRIIKQPKLYFFDTGLVSYLLGIESAKDVKRHFARGALFENYVAIELLKNRYNRGKESNLYFWRDSHGAEVDFIIDSGANLLPIEVKSSETLEISLFKGINYWQKISNTDNGYLVYAGDKSQNRSNVKIIPWNQVNQVF